MRRRRLFTMLVGLAAGGALGGAWLMLSGSEAPPEAPAEAPLDLIEELGLLGMIAAPEIHPHEPETDAWTYLADTASVRLFYACRGDRDRATLVRGVDVASLEGIENVCLSWQEPEEECPPCREDYVDEEDPELRSEQLAEYEAELADWKDWTRTHREAADQLTRTFEEDPWVLISLTGPAAPEIRKDKIFVYVVTFRATSDCEEDEDALATLRILPESLPWPAPGETVQHWIPAVRYSNAVHGLIAASDAGSALTWLEEEEFDHVYYEDVMDYAPAPSDVATRVDCTCCEAG